MSAMKKTYSMNDFKAGYHDITELYDYAEELIATVENTEVEIPEEQLELVEPLINEVADATDVLAEEFLLVAESKNNNAPNKSSKKRIEGALRRIFVAIHDYQEGVKVIAKKTRTAAKNIADPIVEKIQAKLDKVVVIFLEFLQISLQSIMNKTQLDALKARDARVALMMHQLSLNHQ